MKSKTTRTTETTNLKNFIKTMSEWTVGLKLLLLLSVCFLTPYMTVGQCTWVPKGTATSSNCEANGSITISLTGADVGQLHTVLYSIPALNILPNSSAVFSGLPKGTHIVVIDVICAKNGGSTDQKTVSVYVGGSYTAPALATTLTRNSLECSGAQGRVTLNITGSSTPYTVKIVAPYPESYTGPLSFTTSTSPYLVDNLSAGSYNFQVVDNCGKTTEVRSVTIKALTYTIPQNTASPAISTDGNGCNVYHIGSPSLAAGDWLGYSASDTPFEFAMSFDGVTYSDYKKMGFGVAVDNTVKLPLPDGKQYSDYYGLTDFLKMRVRVCGIEYDASTKIWYGNTQFGTNGSNYVGSFETVNSTYTNQCQLGFTRSFFLRSDLSAICYPVTVTLKNNATGVEYTGKITGPKDILTTPILPFGSYTATYTTSTGGLINTSFSNPAPSPTPYSILAWMNFTGLNNKAHHFQFTSNIGNFTPGTVITLVNGPASHMPYQDIVAANFVNTIFNTTGNQNGDASNTWDANHYWPAGDYEWEVKDNCGVYTFNYTIAPTDVYNYTMGEFVTSITCDGMVVTPSGTATIKGANVAPASSIGFGVHSKPTGSAYISSIKQGESFLLQTPGTYKIGISASIAVNYFGDPNTVMTTIVYTKDAPTVDIAHTTGFVCRDGTQYQGQIKVTATKGVLPYTYYLYDKDMVEITNNTTGEFPNTLGLERGKDYTVKVVDACGASSSNQPVKILDLGTGQLVNHNKTAFCEGEQLEFTAIALPNPSYQWYFNGKMIIGETQPKLTISNLTASNAGNYNVIITSTSCQVASASPEVAITVSARPVMPSASNVLHPDFCSGASGKVTIKASVLGVTYQLYNTATGGTVLFSGVGTGGNLDITVANTSATYYLGVINAQGCIQTGSRLSITMNVLSAPSIVSHTITKPSCFGGNDGSITITASGGTGQLEYSKDGVTWQANATLTGLVAGIYPIQVRDANTCSPAAGSAIVTAPTVLTATFATTPVNCNGASTGTITVKAGGGTTSYQYFIDKGAGWVSTPNPITGLSAGSYEVKIVDAKGCAITSVPQIITEPTAITLNITNKLAASCGTAGGGFMVEVTGGTPPYQYQLGTGAWLSTNTFTNLQVGTYGLKVKDNKNCIVNETVVIESNLAILNDAFSFSDGPASYGIAKHAIASCLFLGGLDPAKVQDVAQPSGLANTALNDDGINGGLLDRVGEYTNLNHANFTLHNSGKLTATVQITNSMATGANVMAWIDFNQNGVFDSDEASALINVAAGTLNQPFTAVWTNAGTQFRNGITYLRVRITSKNLTVADANKAFADGEVEDYRLNLQLQTISKTATVQGTGGKIAKIGDIVEYQMTLTNHLPTTVNMDVFDYVPANTEYITSSANPSTATYNTVTKKLSWSSVNLGANASATFKFEAKVISYPDTTGGNYPAKIPNIAYAVNGTDTINSAKDCDLSEITVNPVIANDDCGITMINTQRYFDILKNDIPPIFIPFDLEATVGATASIHLADTTLMYKSLLDYVGLDSVAYKIGVVGRSHDSAKVRIAVVKPLSEKFQFCPNVVDSIGVASIPKVTFKWYKQNGTPATSTNANGNKLEIKMGTSDTIFYVAAIINGCVTDSIPINVYKASLQIHPDIRLHACPAPNRVINLASYLDTTYFTGVTWTHIAGAPIAGVQGQINSEDLAGTGTYKFKIDTYCGSSEAKFYVTSNTVNKVREEQTIVVCHEFAESLHLLQMLGIEAGGSWTTIPPAASSYVKTATLAPLTGAMIFNGKQAYDDVPGSDPQVFEFIYTAGASSCIPNKEIKLKIILTDTIL